MDKIIEILSNAEWVTILAVLGIMWLYNSRVDRKLDKMEERLRDHEDQIERRSIERTDQLEKRLVEKIESYGKKAESQANDLKFQIEKLEHNLQSQINKLDEKVTDIDRRLWRLEGAFTSKDCCMLKDDRIAKQAE